LGFVVAGAAEGGVGLEFGGGERFDFSDVEHAITYFWWRIA
jgi:hypothetical protein